MQVDLCVCGGTLSLQQFALEGLGEVVWTEPLEIAEGATETWMVQQRPDAG